MNASAHTTAAGATAARIDRLVDGELDEAARAALLRDLDREPDGWKRCAIAFLEAQAWRAAVTADGAAGPPTSYLRMCGMSRGQAPGRLFGLAAAVAVAFSIGFIARGPGTDGGHRSDTWRTVAHAPSNDTPSPVRAIAATAHSGQDSPAVPDSLRLRMERQGYRIEGDRKIVPVALQDGRQLAVPVDTVSLKYVGQRIH